MKTILAWVKKVHWPSLAIATYVVVACVALFYWLLTALIDLFNAINFW
jgi:hypothetical protein